MSAFLFLPGAVLREGQGGHGPPMKNVAPGCPPIWPSLPIDFHLNRPVISLIQLHIVPPPLAGIVARHCPLTPIWLVREPPLIFTVTLAKEHRM